MELNTISGLAIAGVICSVVLSMGGTDCFVHCTCPKSIEGIYVRKCKGSAHCEFYLERDNELTDMEVEEIHRTMLMDDSDFK